MRTRIVPISAASVPLETMDTKSYLLTWDYASPWVLPALSILLVLVPVQTDWRSG
jgi:hypothetical protein